MNTRRENDLQLQIYKSTINVLVTVKLAAYMSIILNVNKGTKLIDVQMYSGKLFHTCEHILIKIIFANYSIYSTLFIFI